MNRIQYTRCGGVIFVIALLHSCNPIGNSDITPVQIVNGSLKAVYDHSTGKDGSSSDETPSVKEDTIPSALQRYMN